MGKVILLSRMSLLDFYPGDFYSDDWRRHIGIYVLSYTW